MSQPQNQPQNPPRKGGRIKNSDMHIRPFLPPPVVFHLNNDSTLKIEDIRISVAATPKETEHFFHLVQEQFLIQGFNMLKASPGALRHAQSLETSLQPEGSANPIGIKQLKTHEGCDMTTGSAVMLYSGEEKVVAALMAMLVDPGCWGKLFSIAVEDDWTWVRANRRKRQKLHSCS